MQHGHDSSRRLTPNLFLLGCPKSGSTFLFSCLRAGPFDPNLVCGGTVSWRSCAGRRFVLTTLGAKKEFNYWGSTGWKWGLDWYTGVRAPIDLWEWAVDPSGTGARTRTGEAAARAPGLCLLPNASERFASGMRTHGSRAACSRFPLQCVDGELRTC